MRTAKGSGRGPVAVIGVGDGSTCKRGVECGEWGDCRGGTRLRLSATGTWRIPENLQAVSHVHLSPPMTRPEAAGEGYRLAEDEGGRALWSTPTKEWAWMRASSRLLGGKAVKLVSIGLQVICNLDEDHIYSSVCLAE